MTKPDRAANAAGLPSASTARSLAIGRALQELEPDLMDIVRLSHLVSAFLQEGVGRSENGIHMISVADIEALVFGVCDIDLKLRRLGEAFDRAFEEAPAA